MVDYIIFFISAFGLFLNISCLIFIWRSSIFKHSYYTYLSCKIFFDTCICVIGVSFQSCYDPFNCLTNQSYWKIFYQFYISGIGIRYINLGAYISEVYLNMNRYYGIRNIKNMWTSKILKFYCVPLLFFFLIYSVVLLLGIVHIKREKTGLYSIFITSDYKGIIILIQLATVGILLCFLLISNIKLLVRYRKMIKIKRRSFKNLNMLLMNRKEKQFTAITIAQGFFLLIFSTISIICSAIYTHSFASLSSAGRASSDTMTMLRRVSYYFLFGYHSLNILFNVFGDNNFKKLKDQLFPQCKKQRNNSPSVNYTLKDSKEVSY